MCLGGCGWRTAIGDRRFYPVLSAETLLALYHALHHCGSYCPGWGPSALSVDLQVHCQPSERLQHLSNLVKLWPEGEMDVDQLQQAMQRAIDNPKAVVKRRRRTSLGSSDASVGPEATRPSAGIHRLERYVHPEAFPSVSMYENHNCMPPQPALTMHPYHSLQVKSTLTGLA